MNIFYLNTDPKLAAADLCDKHLSKMLLESCQLMCTAKAKLEPEVMFEGQYKSTHANHPSAIWTRESYENFVWLLEHAEGISEQYTLAYKKIHKSTSVLAQLRAWVKPEHFPKTGFVAPPQCMPEEFKTQDCVQAYRNYYIGDKARFAKWKTRATPEWWKNAV